MRFNKQELIALASQTSNNFDREGVLVLKEKQDGFFRRSEGSTVRWFRLRGNLLFYLKGPEPWYEPMGVIILGRHKIMLQPQDENTHWPFHIVWANGVCYKMATFHESERTLWLKSIELGPYDGLHAQITDLTERLNKIRPVLDIASFRVQKGVLTDVNEVPLYELALSCDNLICDTLGRPPSPMAIVYLKYSKGPMVRYGSTEVVETCSNPSFSKTILFRASDGLTGDAIVKIVIYDVKEMVSDTMVPLGFIALQLSMIQEAQRLRVALQSQDKNTKGFVTINGWSLEPSYSGASPNHNNNEKNSIDIPLKLPCHRRSHSLPPKLGLKLKFPSHGSLFKLNFLNSYQVTYRFHSGLGGDITVHEIMAEPKICFLLPVQLLDIFIRREKDMLEGLLLIGDDYGHLQARQMELVSIHVALLKHYCRARQSLQSIENLYFKASSRKDDPNLEFAPTNLHLQRMWVYNDTLNKSGFHDVITVGAFTAHTHLKSNKNGGLIRLVQQVKHISDANYATYNATAHRVEAEYDKVTGMSILGQELINCCQDLVRMKSTDGNANRKILIEAMKTKLKSIVSLWEPNVIEENLSSIGWTKLNGQHITENQPSTVFRLTEQMSVFHNPDSLDSSCSSKETSPTSEHAGLSSSVPNIGPNGQSKSIDSGLEFDNEYFNMDRRTTNHSFRSIRSPGKRMNNKQSSFELYKRAGSLRHDYKNSVSLEQVSYRINGTKHKSVSVSKELASCSKLVEPTLRRENQMYLKSIAAKLERLIDTFLKIAVDPTCNIDEGTSKDPSVLQESIKCGIDELSYWQRLSHTALRLRCEHTAWTNEHAALQTRRDTCFSQALTTVTAGLLCWLCSTPHEVVVKLLTSGLGPLCEFEGLLSLYSNEKPMWGDMVVAVEDLQTVVFSLIKVTNSNSTFPYASGSRGAITVHIPISDSLYASFNSKEQLTFTVTAVFFNIGINEKATLAEALGETTPQYQSNCDNLDRLNKYYYRYCKVFPPDPASAIRMSSRTKPLEEVIENLRIVVHKRVPKNIEVLKLVSLATRLMNGVRFTSCKSAKDRTGMAVTLEQCTILSSEYHLAEHDGKKAIDVIRREGCRRENTIKNIGIKKYAFTKKQVMSLPEAYRPPAGTYGSTQT